MLILSGMQPDGTGVGRLLSYLVQEAAARPAGDVRIVCRRSWRSPWKLLRHGRVGESLAVWRDRQEWQRLLEDPKVLRADPLVLIQPQALGVRWCEQLIENRRSPTWLYLMDSSFFCLRSYNHIDGEHAACTRCLGGRWQWAAQLGCRPWPVHDAATGQFVQRLREWIVTGRVRCLVQNRRQAELLQTHCGGQGTIQVVGLWTIDLDVHATRQPPTQNRSGARPTVVFHGASIGSKGMTWAIEVARNCPQLTFLFPFPPRQLKLASRDVPANIRCQPMTWETGLAGEVAQAAMVLVPSLWSATMEGALLKSIVAGRAVAVVDEPTAYSSELPAGLLLRLAGDPCQAARQLSSAIADHWKPDPAVRENWVVQLERANRNLLDRIIAACQHGQTADSGADWSEAA